MDAQNEKVVRAGEAFSQVKAGIDASIKGVEAIEENANKDDILGEMRFLENLFNNIISKAKASKSPSLLYLKDNVAEEIISRQNTDLQKIVVNSHILEEYTNIPICSDLFL